MKHVLAFHAQLQVRRGDHVHAAEVDRLDWCDDDELLDSLRAETGEAALGKALERAGARLTTIDQPDDARPVYEWERTL